VKWLIKATGTPGESTLIITVTTREQRRLKSYLRRDRKVKRASHEPAFDSDDLLYDLLEPMFSDDSFCWLPEGATGDLTSAPMVGILGDEMPGPPKDKAVCAGLYHCGRWGVDGELREIYQPVRRRWAFMDYALTSPQRELAEHGRCEWFGGDYWGSQESAEQDVAEFEARENENAARTEA